jgi:hypothetical protein
LFTAWGGHLALAKPLPSSVLKAGIFGDFVVAALDVLRGERLLMFFPLPNRSSFHKTSRIFTSVAPSRRSFG